MSIFPNIADKTPIYTTTTQTIPMTYLILIPEFIWMITKDYITQSL